jgi:hypothetical protein
MDATLQYATEIAEAVDSGLKGDHAMNESKLADAASKENNVVVDHTPKPKRKGGRRPSPRTGQIHARVLPAVAEEIAAEARQRGVQQGVVLEEAWALYRAAYGIADGD